MIVCFACHEPVIESKIEASEMWNDAVMDVAELGAPVLDGSLSLLMDSSRSDGWLDMERHTSADFGHEDVWNQVSDPDAGQVSDLALMDSSGAQAIDHTQLLRQTYMPLIGSLANPERGFYTHIETVLSHESSTGLDAMLLDRLNQSGRRLVLFVVDLSRYTDTALHNDALLALDADFRRIRIAGLKAIVRFRYAANSTPPYGDASPEQVQAHLVSLTTVLRANADIIMTLQVGFIGAWGEWFYSDHWGDLGQWSPTDLDNRRALVAQLLNILPVTRTVQLRTPLYRTALFGSQHDCESGSTLGRIGQHNDCFLASETDFGTYQNPMVDYPWLALNTQCVPMGGETCAVFGDRSSCATALEEMRRFHWSYLNGSYHPDVLSNWSDEGCLSTIEQHLGYRLTLDSASHSVQTAPGAPFQIQFSGRNLGFAPPVNPREVAIVLAAVGDGRQWVGTLDADPRGWLEAFDIDGLLGVPDDMPPGGYHVFLRLSDPEPSLRHRPEYAIQLANEGLYDARTGLHDLLSTVEIRQGAALPYNGVHWFEPLRND